MIRLVAFDWNGTLLSDAQTVVDACNHFIAELGGEPITLEIYRQKFTVPVIDFYESVGLDRQKVLENSLKNSEVFHNYYELKVSNLRTRAGARQVLAWLSQNQIDSVIFSNHVTKRIHGQLIRLNVDKYVTRVLANDQIDDALKGKNKKEKLAKFIKTHNFKPQEILIVGDSNEEIEIAHELGSISIAITHGHYSTTRLKAAKPTYLINNLREVIGIIEKLKT